MSPDPHEQRLIETMIKNGSGWVVAAPVKDKNGHFVVKATPYGGGAEVEGKGRTSLEATESLHRQIVGIG